jgi:hypothetical protein
VSTAIALGLNIKLLDIKVSNILAPESLHYSLVNRGNGEPNHVVSDPLGALSNLSVSACGGSAQYQPRDFSLRGTIYF